jgi:hypothetical protein
MTIISTTEKEFDLEIKRRQQRNIIWNNRKGGRKKGSKDGMSLLNSADRCRKCYKKVDEFEVTTLGNGVKICNACYNNSDITSRLFYNSSNRGRY